MRRKIIKKGRGRGAKKEEKDETRKSTPALPNASLSVAISAVSIPLFADAVAL